MSLQKLKFEPVAIEDRKPATTRKSFKNLILHEHCGWYRPASTYFLWSDLKDSVMFSNDLKSSEVTVLGEKVPLHKN